MPVNAAYWRALILEKANHTKEVLAKFDKLAGPDDAAFRKAVLEYFKPGQPFTADIIERAKEYPVSSKCPVCGLSMIVSPKGGYYCGRCQKDYCNHEWGTDGFHLNEFCKKCFVNKPK